MSAKRLSAGSSSNHSRYERCRGASFRRFEVDESAGAPHAIENSRKVYVRTGNASNPYDLADVDSILELVKRRREPFAEAHLIDRAKERFRFLRAIKACRSGGTRSEVGTLLGFPSARGSLRDNFAGKRTLRLTSGLVGRTWRGVMFPDPVNPFSPSMRA